MVCKRSASIICVGAIAALLSGCASDELLKRMDMAERNIRTLDRNGAAFEAAFRQQAEVGNAHTRDLQTLRRLIEEASRQQQAQTLESREMRRLLEEALAITSRLEIKKFGSTAVIVTKQ